MAEDTPPAVTRRSTQRFPVVFNVALLVVSSLVALACLELVLRTFFPGKYVYYSSYAERPMVYFAPFGSTLAPDFNDTLYDYRIYTVGSPLVPWRVKTNHFGWREPELAITKAPGTKRLMVLGDSVTYGMALDYQDTHASYLKHALHLDRQDNWEVLNRSIPGWGGWHEREYLRLEGKNWSPDVVTVNAVMNDFKPLTDVEYQATIRKPPLLYGLYRRFRFMNLVRVARQQRAPLPSAVLEFYRSDSPPSWYGWWNKDKWWYIRGEYDTPAKEAFYRQANELSFPRYLDIKRECDRMGAYCLVVVYPTASQTSLKYWMRQKQGEAILKTPQINEFCDYLARNNIPFVNLLEAFRQETTHPLFVDECHLTEHGHRIAAEEVLKHLQRSNVVHLYDMPLWD